MEKQEKIIEMFDQIAPSYDKANRILSFGVDTSWRVWACKYVLSKFPKNITLNIADIACGTGDMIGIWEKESKKVDIDILSISGIDPSSGMLEVAKKKFKNHTFIKALATSTTLASQSTDIVSISYGIRNVVERQNALLEFNRILKPGGYVTILEFTKRDNSGLLPKIRDFYLSKILPTIGGFISKNREAYTYLPNSIDNFLSKDSFRLELSKAGFEIDLCKGFSFDVSTLFVAKKVKNYDSK